MKYLVTTNVLRAVGRSVIPNSSLLGLLSPEARLLLLTAGGATNDGALREVLAEGLNWNEVLRLLEWERALPVAWSRLKTLGVDTTTADAVAIERLSRVSEFNAMTLEDRLLRLVRGFEEEGIPVVLLKGAGLALSAYDSFSERPMGDLDVLVAPRHSRRAWDKALAQGWVWDEHEYPQRHYQAHHHLPPLFDGARTGARLELHTALSLSSHPFSLSFEDAQAVSKGVTGRGASLARVLDTEHALIHLAVHYAWGHLASFGIWRLARDVDALARQAVDWDRVAALARKYRAEFALYWSLRLVSNLSGVAPAPAGLLKAMAPRKPGWVLSLLERHFAVHAISLMTPCPSDKMRRFMWGLALAPDHTATSRERPWDSEPARRPTVYTGDVAVARRIRAQLGSGQAWRRYLRSLLSAS